MGLYINQNKSKISYFINQQANLCANLDQAKAATHLIKSSAKAAVFPSASNAADHSSLAIPHHLAIQLNAVTARKISGDRTRKINSNCEII
jgi:hypothetical protein